MKQSTAFLRGAGDKWYRRNISKSREPDRVIEAINACQLKPKSILEIGCGNGWRLVALRSSLGALCFGIDPSKEAIQDAPQKDGIKCWRGTADNLKGVRDNSIDMVIYGFCLYLCDREDLFAIMAESNRVLRDNGTVVLHDFFSDRPYAREYEHQEGIKSFKMDYGGLWLANPGYRSIYKDISGTESSLPKNRDDQVVVQVLRKDAASAFPLKGIIEEPLPWED